jgi:hypothetical protein
LNQVENESNRNIATALIVVQMEYAVIAQEVAPAVAGRNDNFLFFALTSPNILGDPRSQKVSAKMGEFVDLLDQMLDLVKGDAFGGWKIMESGSV